MANLESLYMFLRKEGKVLMGHRSINFIVIFLIFAISLLSISFSKAGLFYLESKMDDPFVKWVDIKALQKSGKGLTPIDKFLFSDSISAKYDFSYPKAGYTYSGYFCKISDNSEPQLQGRSFDAEGSLFDKIVEEGKNGIVKVDYIANTTNGIIITLDALKNLGYINSTKSFNIEQLPKYVMMSIPFNKSVCETLLLGSGNEGYYPVAIPVLAVVRDVPGVEYSFMFSDEYMKIMFDGAARDITSLKYNGNVRLYGRETDILKKTIKQLRMEYKDSVSIKADTAIGWVKGKNSGYMYVDVSVNTPIFSDTQRVVLQNKIANRIISEDSTNSIIRVYDLESERNYSGQVQLYSIEINDLKKIRDLQSALKNDCNIRLDMRNIESQENFQKMEAVGEILSISIIILVILFVTVFIFFLLNTHFQSIQMNLGTFKAFGIQNRMLYTIYLLLMFGMTLLSFLLAWMIIVIIKFGLDRFGLQFEQGYSYFDVLSLPIWFLFGFVMIDAIVTTLYIAYRRLHHTPGNLIYNRQPRKQ